MINFDIGWSIRDGIKVNLQIDLILPLDEYSYPPITLDDVDNEVLVQAEISRNMLVKNSWIEITIMIFIIYFQMFFVIQH